MKKRELKPGQVAFPNRVRKHLNTGSLHFLAPSLITAQKACRLEALLVRASYTPEHRSTSLAAAPSEENLF